MSNATPQAPDVREHGGRGQESDRRLFMQLLVFTQAPMTGNGDGGDHVQRLIDALAAAELDAVLYADVHHPHGLGLLTMSEEPGFFPGRLRQLLGTDPWTRLTLRPAYTMFGRTYSLGYEADLEDTLLQRPRRHVMDAESPWAVWYPLRRSGAFAQLDQGQQREILREHGRIGMAFGRAELAHDVRLACFGLDSHDNDFVIGLTGRGLHPLSALVQRMRATTQTSQYIERLGPFFVGHMIWHRGAK